MKNLFKPALLACAALFALASCSAEQEPQASQTPSQGEGLTMSFSLSVAPPSLGGMNLETPSGTAEPKASFRSWSETKGVPFDVVDATGIYVRPSDDDQASRKGNNSQESTVKAKVTKLNKELFLKENPTRKFLLQIRKKGATGFAYHEAEWRYNGDIGAYEFKEGQIALPWSVSASDSLYARLVTGATYDSSTKRLSVDEVAVEMDLSKESSLRAPIPFASSWVPLDVDLTSGQLYIAQKSGVHKNRIQMKPLGSLLVLAFRNTSSEPVTFQKVRFLTNNLLFSGYFNLDEQELKCVPPDDETTKSYKVYDIAQIRDKFREKELSLDAPLTLPAKAGLTNDTHIFVTWIAPVYGRKSVANGLGGTVEGGAQTMVFPVEPKGPDGNLVRYPNYAISPIMGTNLDLKSGKAYALNCEFYEGVRPLLGYYAQYTVNENGDGFDTSHEPANVSLVHYTKAREFLAGKQLTQPGTTNRATYLLGGRGTATLLTQLFGIPFNRNGASSGVYTFRSSVDGTTEWVTRNAMSMPNLVYNQTTQMFDSMEDQSANWYFSMWGKRTSQDGIAYMLSQRGQYGLTGEGREQGPARSNSQSIYRIEATGWPTNLRQLKIRSIVVGKYFVGGLYAPVYRGKNLFDESIWNDPIVNQAGFAERIIPAPGLYKYQNLTQSDDQLLRPASTDRNFVGEKSFYWFNMGYGSNYLLAWYTPRRNTGVLNTNAWGRPSTNTLPVEFQFDSNFETALQGEFDALAAGRHVDGVNGKVGNHNISPGDRLSRAPGVQAGYPGLNGMFQEGFSGSPFTLSGMRPYIWLALLPYSTTYQGDAATVPSHER